MHQIFTRDFCSCQKLYHNLRITIGGDNGDTAFCSIGLVETRSYLSTALVRETSEDSQALQAVFLGLYSHCT